MRPGCRVQKPGRGSCLLAALKLLWWADGESRKANAVCRMSLRDVGCPVKGSLGLLKAIADYCNRFE